MGVGMSVCEAQQFFWVLGGLAVYQVVMPREVSWERRGQKGPWCQGHQERRISRRMRWSALPNASEESHRMGIETWLVGFDNEITSALCQSSRVRSQMMIKECRGSCLYYPFEKFWGKGGAWLAQRSIWFDLGVMSLSLKLDVEIN